MATVSTENSLRGINEQFLNEYSSEQAIRRYTRETAGHGINYLLENDYGEIYMDALKRIVSKSEVHDGLRILEFGCGAGMNLLHLVSLMQRNNLTLQCAYGTDFSPRLIEAASREAATYLPRVQREKVHFCVARNEKLVEDLTASLSIAKSALVGSFHFILGVNTFRYCHRLKKELECATAIFNLLSEGAICVMIDMNKGFPLFRSRFRDRFVKKRESYYLPSLEEYAEPFSAAGFEILRKGNFCWIPHSAGLRLSQFLRALTPALDSLVPNHAMRSLVIAQKPCTPKSVRIEL
jgi:SAM-dependent methyltransferase